MRTFPMSGASFSPARGGPSSVTPRQMPSHGAKLRIGRSDCVSAFVRSVRVARRRISCPDETNDRATVRAAYNRLSQSTRREDEHKAACSVAIGGQLLHL